MSPELQIADALSRFIYAVDRLKTHLDRHRLRPRRTDFLPRDVDDGYALAAVIRAAHLEPSVFEILGIATTSGSTDESTALACVEGLLDAFKITKARLVNQAHAA